jgi:hypothetical protein
MRHVLVQGLVSLRTYGSWAVVAEIHPLSLPFILPLLHTYSFVELHSYLYVIIKQLSL